jgi:hypothetical protein
MQSLIKILIEIYWYFIDMYIFIYESYFGPLDPDNSRQMAHFYMSLIMFGNFVGSIFCIYIIIRYELYI